MEMAAEPPLTRHRDTMPRLRTFAIAIASAALAVASAMFALSRATEFHSPLVSALLPVANGVGEAQYAALIMAMHMSDGGAATPKLDPADRAKVISLSRSALAQEPLFAGGLRNLGLIASADGDTGKARLYMRDAERLSRRDLAVNGWLIADYAKQGDLEAAFKTYDHALRTSALAQTRLLPVMIDLLANSSLVQPTISLLRPSPPWADAFWHEAPQHPAALQNLAQIRVALAREGYRGNVQRDAALLRALTRVREFGAAQSLFDALAKPKRPPGELLNNGNFDHPPEFEPFDWRTFFDSTLSADVQPRSSLLQIDTFSDGSGLVARQAVALTATRYVLEMGARNWNPAASGMLYAQLRCAERGKSAESALIPMEGAKTSAAVLRPSANCTYYWLELHANPWPDRQEHRILLDNVSLRAVAG